MQAVMSKTEQRQGLHGALSSEKIKFKKKNWKKNSTKKTQTQTSLLLNYNMKLQFASFIFKWTITHMPILYNCVNKLFHKTRFNKAPGIKNRK